MNFCGDAGAPRIMVKNGRLICTYFPKGVQTYLYIHTYIHTYIHRVSQVKWSSLNVLYIQPFLAVVAFPPLMRSGHGSSIFLEYHATGMCDVHV
jgi:hypothetical protein